MLPPPQSASSGREAATGNPELCKQEGIIHTLEREFIALSEKTRMKGHPGVISERFGANKKSPLSAGV